MLIVSSLEKQVFSIAETNLNTCAFFVKIEIYHAITQVDTNRIIAR